MMNLLVVAATDGELAGIDDVETLACGVGPVEAAIAVAARLAVAPRVDAVLHVGIAGARRASAIAPGDVVLGSSSTYCDTTSHLVPREIAPDQRMLARLVAALPMARMCPVGTSADVGGSAECDVEAMEGFAVLRAAAAAGVPAVELRVVSNEIEEPDRERWQFGLALAVLGRTVHDAIDALRGFEA